MPDTFIDTRTLIETGKAIGAKPIDAPGTKPAVVLPDGYVVEYLDQEEPPKLPDFIEEKPHLFDLESFVAYVKLYSKHLTRIFAEPGRLSPPSPGKFIAYFDYHEAGVDGKPQRNAHTATYPLPFSVEFGAWLSIHGKPISQTAFANFIDEQGQTIYRPDSAALLEMSLNFDAKKSVTFSSRIDRHKGGRRLTFNEDVEAKMPGGQLDVPDTLGLHMPIFEAGRTHSFEARLSLDIQNGKLFLVVTLQRVHAVLREALKEVRMAIEAETAVQVLTGEL